MPDELPMACSLSADALPARLAEISDVGRAALDDARVDGRHAVLRFRATEGTRGRLAAIVAAERECCAFLDLRLTDEPGAVVLTIDAPDGAEPVLAELVSAFAR